MSHIEDKKFRPVWDQLAKAAGARELPAPGKEILLEHYETQINLYLGTGDREDLEPLIPAAKSVYTAYSLGGSGRRQERKEHGNEEESNKEATPSVGEYERLRAAVLSEYLAKMASMEPKVAHFRNDVLENEFLTVEEAHAFCSSPASRFLNSGVWRACGIPARHSAVLLDENLGRMQEGPFHWVRVRTDPPGEEHAVFGPQSYEHITVRDAKGRARRVSFWPNSSSVLGELRKICAEITKAHPWDVDQATWFVLTGVVPCVRPIKSTISTQQSVGGRAYTTISLTIQPWVPPEVVKLVYQQAQKQVIGGKPGRLGDKNLSLLSFVVARAGRNGNLPRGEVLVRDWDRKCKKERRPTEWCYGADTRRFFRDFRNAEKSVTNSKRAGIVQEWWPEYTHELSE